MTRMPGSTAWSPQRGVLRDCRRTGAPSRCCGADSATGDVSSSAPSHRTEFLRLLPGLDPAPSESKARTPGDNHQSEGHDRGACHLPARDDQRRPVAHGVAPAHVPTGFVARRCVSKPSEIVWTRLSGQRHRDAATHQHKAQDPPQMTKHATSIPDTPLNFGEVCSSARWRVRCVDPQARHAWDTCRAGQHARSGSRCPRRTPGLR